MHERIENFLYCSVTILLLNTTAGVLVTNTAVALVSGYEKLGCRYFP
jgi:hypothetical protein